VREYGTDAVRYFLLARVHPFEDSDVTPEGFKKVYNGQLANGLGNLVSRVMKLTESHLSQAVEIKPGTFANEYLDGVHGDTVGNYRFDLALMLVMAGGNLILSNFNRQLLVISPLDGKIIQTIKTSEKIYHTPIIVDKKLYLHTIGRFSVDLVTIE
jgi:hypothetical protein